MKTVSVRRSSADWVGATQRARRVLRQLVSPRIALSLQPSARSALPLDDARKSLAKATDDQLQKSWRLLYGGKVLDDRPRHLILADTISHLAHHRGQLTVYLRLNDKPVPAIYGASADEGW